MNTPFVRDVERELAQLKAESAQLRAKLALSEAETTSHQQGLINAQRVINAAQQEATDLRQQNTRIKEELNEIVAVLPETFYSSLPTKRRLEFMVQSWNRTIVVNQGLEAERDALASACAQLQNPDNWEAPCGSRPRWIGPQMHFPIPDKILSAHDAALTGPLVEALENILECFPKDYNIRITEIAREALAPYREAKR